MMRRSSSGEDNKNRRRESGVVAITEFHPVASLWRRRQTAFAAMANTSAQPAASSVSKTVGVLVRNERGRKREEAQGGGVLLTGSEVFTICFASDPSNQSGVLQTSTDAHTSKVSPNCLTLLLLKSSFIYYSL